MLKIIVPILLFTIIFSFAIYQTPKDYYSADAGTVHGAVMGAVCGFFIAAVYMVPAIVAERRKHPQRLPIYLLTLFGSWLVIGWIVALVWATIQRPGQAEPASPAS